MCMCIIFFINGKIWTEFKHWQIKMSIKTLKMEIVRMIYEI